MKPPKSIISDDLMLWVLLERGPSRKSAVQKNCNGTRDRVIRQTPATTCLQAVRELRDPLFFLMVNA